MSKRNGSRKAYQDAVAEAQRLTAEAYESEKVQRAAAMLMAPPCLHSWLEARLFEAVAEVSEHPRMVQEALTNAVLQKASEDPLPDVVGFVKNVLLPYLEEHQDPPPRQSSLVTS